MSLPSLDSRAIPLILCSLVSLPTGVRAQITPDQTLGPEASEVITDQLVRGDMADLIEGGATRGGNLFHSFSEFNLADGQRVYFANPEEITSILSRITGNNSSEIFGTLGVDGSADLFLINPNGLVFGENAQLDIDGSFYGTTAEAVEVGNGVFSATAPEQSQLLAVNPSVEFWNYLTNNSGNVVNRGQLAIGGDLVLAGNSLDLQGQIGAVGDISLLATDTVKIRDTADVPFITLAGEDLLVQGNQQVNIIALSHPDSGLFSYGDMILRSDEPVGGDAHYLSGSNFRVERLDGGGGELFSPIDPIIRAFGDVEIEGYLGSSLHIIAGGSVSIGTVIINAPDPGTLNIDFLKEEITLSDGTIVAVDGGNQPTLDVRAGVKQDVINLTSRVGVSGQNITTDFFFDNELFITEPILGNDTLRADISIGDVRINAPDGLVLLTNQYSSDQNLIGGDITINGNGIDGDGLLNNDGINAQGGNDAGSAVFLDSRNDINIEGFLVGINTSSNTANGGNITLIADQDILLNAIFGGLTTNRGGNINISANHLLVEPLAGVTTFSTQEGKGGNISIQTKGSVNIDDGTLGSVPALAGDTGSSGNIDIQTSELVVTGRFSTISSRTLNNNRAGSINIQSDNLLLEDGAQILTNTDSAVQAGDIFVQANESIELQGISSGLGGTFRSGIQADTEGVGNAGNVMLTTPQLLIKDGARLGSQVQRDSSGQGGDVNIISDNILLQNGGQITAGTFGTGEGGTLTINNTESITIFETDGDGSPSGLFTATLGFADAGNLSITTTDLSVLDGGQTSTSTLGVDRGRGGNLIINATGTVNISGASIDQEFESVLTTGSGILLDTTFRGSVADGGNLFLNTENLIVQDSGSISTQTFGTGVREDFLGQAGNAGNLSINATGTVEVNLNSRIVTNTDGAGDAGDLKLTASQLFVRNNSEISASTNGDILNRFEATGEGGDLNIIVTGLTKLSGEGGLGTLSNLGSDAGDIDLRTGSLIVENGANISASAFGRGEAGDIGITTPGTVSVIGGRLVSGDEFNNFNNFVGETVFDPEEIIFLPSQIITESLSVINQDAGDLNIEADQLRILDGGRVSSSTSGNGAGGNLIINSRLVEVSGISEIENIPSELSAQTSGNGDAGSITIKAPSIKINNQAQVLASATDQGNAGDIFLTAPERIQIQDGTIATNAEASTGGQIQVVAGNIFLFGDSDIQTFVSSGINNGGDIVIEADALVALDDSDILAFAADGRGGNVDLSQTAFFGQNFEFAPPGTDPRTLDNNDRVDINASGGIASGTISLADVSFIQDSLTELPDNLVNPEALVDSSCIARSDDASSGFTITGGDSLPQQPNSSQSTYSLSSVQSITDEESHNNLSVVEPHRVYRLADGRLIMSQECEK